MSTPHLCTLRKPQTKSRSPPICSAPEQPQTIVRALRVMGRADEELDYATRFSCALGLAELQLEEGNQSAAAEVLKAIEPMAPKHNPAAALQYVQLLQRADCQVCCLGWNEGLDGPGLNEVKLHVVGRDE